MPRVDVIGLGPAGADLLTAGARRLWDDAEHRFLRTTVHPSVAAIGRGASFDGLYESSDTFGDVYRTIADTLVDQAGRCGRVVYAVPGSPSVAESSVELLVARADADRSLEVVLHPALSFLELVWQRLSIDPVDLGVRLVDGHRFDTTRPADGGAVVVAQCDSRFTLSDIKLAVDPPPEGQVVVLQRLGSPTEAVVPVGWADIDRAVEPDHLTSLWIPHLPPSAGAQLDQLAELFERLRAADPWKAAQTHQTLGRYLLEEAYEVLEAIDDYEPVSGEGSRELASELGDLLYQVVFHASMAAEAGWFDLGDVVAAIRGKLVARHPHLDSGETPGMEELVADWERAKRTEHGRDSAFDGIPAELPALVRALKLARKADALGLEFPIPSGESSGARLLSLTMALVGQGEDPEDVLRRELRRVEETLRAQET